MVARRMLAPAVAILTSSCSLESFVPRPVPTEAPFCAPLVELESMHLDYAVTATQPDVSAADAEHVGRSMMGSQGVTCSVKLARYDNLADHRPLVWVVHLDGLAIEALAGGFVINGPQPPRGFSDARWCSSRPRRRRRPSRVSRPVADLTSSDLPDGLDGVDLGDGLVRPQADDPRKTHRVSGIVSLARLDLVEGHFDDRVRYHRADAAVVVDGVVLEILRHLGDLFVGEPGVGLADIQEALTVADREGVVREDPPTFAVSPFHGRDDDVERAQRTLHLEPFHATPARSVGGPGVLHHESFVPATARRSEFALEDLYQLFA